MKWYQKPMTDTQAILLLIALVVAIVILFRA
jgi:hypothetical protein